MSRRGLRWAAVTLLAVWSSAGLRAQPQERLEFEEFITATWNDTMPYAEIQSYAAQTAVPILRRILDDPKRVDSWRNALMAFGILGGPEAIDPLTRFVLEGDRRIDAPLFGERAAALFGLAYAIHEADLAGRSDDELGVAIQLLVESPDPGHWERSKLVWRGLGPADDAAELERALTAQAVLALGLTGLSEAGAKLEQLVAPAVGFADPEVLTSARNAYAAVVEERRRSGQGLAKIYAEDEAAVEEP